MSLSRRDSPTNIPIAETKVSAGNAVTKKGNRGSVIKISCETIDLLQELHDLGIDLRDVVARERERQHGDVTASSAPSCCSDKVNQAIEATRGDK